MPAKNPSTTSASGAIQAPAFGEAAGTVPARHAWLLCLLASAIWFGITASLRPLAIPDEGRYVGIAWEMLRSGNWSVPTLDGMPFFHKPPLFYWITAASMHVFGVGVTAARVAPWIAAVATTTGLFAFLSRWVGERSAKASVLVLATMPLFFGGAQYANLDMLVAGCIACTILLFAHATLAREVGEPYQRVLALAFAAAAAGVLAKGLIGAVLPAGVVLCWALATRRVSRVATLLTWAPGWLVFAAIAAPWFIAMQERFPAFFHYFFVVQQFDRFQATGFNNPQPFWFYPAVLLVLTLPWSPWLLGGLVRQGRAETGTGMASDVRALMVAWLAVITVFFSLPNSKLIGYILPALAPLACLIASWVPAGRRPWLALTALLAALVCVAAAVITHNGQPKSRAALAEQMQHWRKSDEPVVFLQNYYYDLAFYARLTAPVLVVDPWLPAELAKDSWRRELTDAESFAPASSARPRLQPGELATTLCRSPGAWLVGPWPAPADPPWLASMPPVYQDGSAALWHIEPSHPAMRAALGCDAQRSRGISAPP